MASSSESESSPEISLAARYRLTHAICFDDITTKCSETEVVLTESFYCPHDPLPTNFRLVLDFGDFKEGYLGVFLKPVSRDVTLTSLRYELLDDRCEVLEAYEIEEPDEYKKLKRRGFAEFYNFNATQNVASSWRLIIDFVYVAAQPVVTTAVQPILRLQEELSQLLDSGKESDISFVVQGEKIKAHKVLLTTRCKHFESMFDSGMAESHSKEVTVNDIKPKTFKDFLRFLYTNMLPDYEEDSTMELLAVADMYCVDDLKEMCERAINSNLNGNNVIDALILADKHHCPTLLSSAKAVFGWHVKALKSQKSKKAW